MEAQCMTDHVRGSISIHLRRKRKDSLWQIKTKTSKTILFVYHVRLYAFKCVARRMMLKKLELTLKKYNMGYARRFCLSIKGKASM